MRRFRNRRGPGALYPAVLVFAVERVAGWFPRVEDLPEKLAAHRLLVEHADRDDDRLPN